MKSIQIKQNVIDKVINFVDPVAGARRIAARGAMAFYGAYNGARFDRKAMREWTVSQGSADADTLLDLRMLRARSRDLQRNAPIAAGAVNTVVANAVGTGLTLQPNPDMEILGWTSEQAQAWTKKVDAEFDLWAESKDCDVTRTQDFYALQSLAFRSCLESGDVFATLPFVKRQNTPYDLAIQIIEGDRIASPWALAEGGKMPNSVNQCWGGVEVDANGAPVAYIIYAKHPGGLDFWTNPKGNEYSRVLAFGAKTGRRNVIHLFDRRRPDQKRGIPYLAPVIETLKQLDRYSEAELSAAVVSAMFTVFVKTPIGEGIAGLNQSANTNGSVDPSKELALGNGAIIDLAQGEDIQIADPKRPNVAFDPFVLAVLRQVGVALELPFEILVKHFTASYSAARAAMLEAWKFYRGRREFLATNFCQPIFEAWMDEAVSMDRVAAPGYFTDPILRRAYLRTNWIGDAPGQIDPQKEADAAKARMDAGLSTGKKEALELTGMDWEDVHVQLAREHRLRVEAGLEPAILNATATEPVMPPGSANKPTDPANPEDGTDQEQPDNLPGGGKKK